MSLSTEIYTQDIHFQQDPTCCSVCLYPKEEMVAHKHPTKDEIIHSVCKKCFSSLDPKRCPECREDYKPEEAAAPERRERAYGIEVMGEEPEGELPPSPRANKCLATATVLLAGALLGMFGVLAVGMFTSPPTSEFLQELGYGALSGVGLSGITLLCCNCRR